MLQTEANHARNDLLQSRSDAETLLAQLNESAENARRLEQRLAEAMTEITELRIALRKQRTEMQGTLTRQITELRSIVATAVEQRQLQSAQEQEIRDRLAHAEARCAALLESTSWRVTAPLRALSVLANEPRRALHGRQRLREDVGGLTRRKTRGQAPVSLFLREERPTPPAAHAALLSPRVLIVAEMSLAQCRKYRVEQKQAMIRALHVSKVTAAVMALGTYPAN